MVYFSLSSKFETMVVIKLNKSINFIKGAKKDLMKNSSRLQSIN